MDCTTWNAESVVWELGEEDGGDLGSWKLCDKPCLKGVRLSTARVTVLAGTQGQTWAHRGLWGVPTIEAAVEAISVGT